MRYKLPIIESIIMAIGVLLSVQGTAKAVSYSSSYIPYFGFALLGVVFIAVLIALRKKKMTFLAGIFMIAFYVIVAGFAYLVCVANASRMRHLETYENKTVTATIGDDQYIWNGEAFYQTGNVSPVDVRDKGAYVTVDGEKRDLYFIYVIPGEDNVFYYEFYGDGEYLVMEKTASETLPETAEEITGTTAAVREIPEVEPAVDYESETYIYHEYLLEHDTFEVTSTDLIDGVWSDEISNTHIGQNNSPQLSWEPVEGATEYVIYMVDSNTNGFLHWKSAGITETELPTGWAPKLKEYNGPHVGHGYTHEFDVYVIALRSPANRLKGAMNWVNPQLDAFMEEVDTDIYGNTGNIIAYGKISGTFTDARFRDGVEPSGPYTM